MIELNVPHSPLMELQRKLCSKENREKKENKSLSLRCGHGQSPLWIHSLVHHTWGWGITLEHCVEHGVKGSGGVYKRVLCYEIWATNWSIKYRSLLHPLWLNLGKRFQDQGHEDVFRDASLPDQLGMFFIGWQEPRKCHMLCPSFHRDRGSMDEDKFSLSFLTQYVELKFLFFLN